MTLPRCYNAPMFEGYWRDTGMLRIYMTPYPHLRAVYRWQYSRMSRECKSWSTGPEPITASVPARENWRCDGCRWLPYSARDYLRGLAPGPDQVDPGAAPCSGPQQSGRDPT